MAQIATEHATQIMTDKRAAYVRKDTAPQALPTTCGRAKQAAVTLLVAGMLLALGPQSPTQAAADRVMPGGAQPEEIQAMEQERTSDPQAVGGGLECKDAFSDVNIALGQRITRNVFCPAGTVAVSGGATATINTGLYINATGPTSGIDVDPNKWFTSVENFSSPSRAWAIRALLCAMLPRRAVTRQPRRAGLGPPDEAVHLRVYVGHLGIREHPTFLQPCPYLIGVQDFCS